MAYPQPGQFPAYPQYPGQSGVPAKPPMPQTVRNAYYLMLTGAALQLVSGIVGIGSTSKLRDSIRSKNPGFTDTQVNNTVRVAVVFSVIGILLGMGLWIWMAYANRAGKNWARITGTVFFGLECLGLIGTLAANSTSALSTGKASGFGVALNILMWLVGLVAVILLWNKESGPYFKPPQFGYGGPGYPYPYAPMPGQQPMPPAGPQQTPYGTPPQMQQPTDPWSNPNPPQ